MKRDDLPQLNYHDYSGAICNRGQRCDFDRCGDLMRPLGALGLLLCYEHRQFLEDADEANKTKPAVWLL